jgi:hypothetical protein
MIDGVRHPMRSPSIPHTAAPIFIVGAPRSGTTLAASILGRHRDVFAPAPGETHFFQDIWSRRREFGRLQDEAELSLAATRLLTNFGRWNNMDVQERVDTAITKEALLDRALNIGGGYGALYYAFTGMLADSAGKRRYCDDTPRHLFYLHTIFDLLPQARVIGCSRDPRDFLCSYKHHWKKVEDSVRIKALYHPVITSLLWRGSSNLLLKHVNQCCRGRVLLVRYEALVQHPREEVSRICSFLGLDYSDELIQIESHNSSFDVSASGIFTTSIGRWRTCLSPEEVWCVQTLTRGKMHTLGYKAEAVSPSKKTLSLTVLSTPLGLVRAIKANSAKTGPLVEYVFRRLSSLTNR